MNASLAPDQASVLAHRRVNLGVAMATPHGLAVPNIKDVQVGFQGPSIEEHGWVGSQSWHCKMCRWAFRVLQ